jgi:hypothetical protein
MPPLDGRMRNISERVLKRPLSDDEELELLRISEELGMSNAHSFLYLLLVFKLHEDSMKGQFRSLESLEERLNGKFGEMGALAARIDKTLEGSIERILRDGAREIGRDMGRHVTEGAMGILGAIGDYHFLRGQVRAVFCISVLAAVSYWLGSAGVFSVGGDTGPLGLLMGLPCGWLAFACGSVYVYMWSWDHWERVRESIYYRGILALQGMALLALFIRMAWM